MTGESRRPDGALCFFVGVFPGLLLPSPAARDRLVLGYSLWPLRGRVFLFGLGMKPHHDFFDLPARLSRRKIEDRKNSGLFVRAEARTYLLVRLPLGLLLEPEGGGGLALC